MNTCYQFEEGFFDRKRWFGFSISAMLEKFLNVTLGANIKLFIYSFLPFLTGGRPFKISLHFEVRALSLDTRNVTMVN